MVNAPPTCACMIPSMVLVVLIVGFVSHTSVWSCHRKCVAMLLMAGPVVCQLVTDLWAGGGGWGGLKRSPGSIPGRAYCITGAVYLVMS